MRDTGMAKFHIRSKTRTIAVCSGGVVPSVALRHDTHHRKQGERLCG
jgi:hypothetical protein